MFAQVRVVVRGGVEPPTFRFSGGFAGPGESTTGQLARPDGASAAPTVHDQPHVSTAVVSAALARSAWRTAPEAAAGQQRELRFHRLRDDMIMDLNICFASECQA
jgi:hypothetical protein